VFHSSDLMRFHPFRTAAVLAVAGVTLAACGGPSKTISVQTQGTAAVQSPPPATPSSAPVTTSAPATNVGGASFCKYAKTEKTQVADEVKAFSLDSPAQLEAFEQRALSDVTALAATAPSSVKAAVATVVATDRAFFNQLKAAHFDYRKLNPTAVEKINTPAFVRAIHTIVNYFEHACGVNNSSSSS
jgi:hypothetical protein